MSSPASKRAELLLRAHLNPEQLESWERRAGFFVRGGRRRYYLSRALPPLLVRKSVEWSLRSYCIYSLGEDGQKLPLGDNLLALKLLIETDESRFRRVANPSTFQIKIPSSTGQAWAWTIGAHVAMLALKVGVMLAFVYSVQGGIELIKALAETYL